MSLATPRSSNRRLVLTNCAKASIAMWLGTPAWRAEAMAINALSILKSPISGHCTVPCSCPLNVTINSLPSSLSFLACQPSGQALCSTGVQLPIAKVSLIAFSLFGDKSKPLLGTIRIRWWNCRWISDKSLKISPWSNSKLLITNVRGR